jgi:hypothetical protein
MGTESIWSFVIIAGPIVLALVIAFALIKNRGRSARDEAVSEAATRREYDELAADRQRRGE